MNCSTPGLLVYHQLPEFTQTQVHWVGDAIQPPHPLLSPSPPAPNPSQPVSKCKKNVFNIIFTIDIYCCCSFAQSCLTLCNPMVCSMPGFPVLRYLPEFVHTRTYWVGDAIPLSSVVPFSSCHLSFPASGSFQMSRLFTSSVQSIGTSASASVLLMNIQGWFPLELTHFISL